MMRRLFQTNKKKSPQLYVTFSESHYSFMAEKRFKQEGIEGKLIASPSFLTTGCGLAWRSDPAEEGRIRQILNHGDLQVEKIQIR